LPIALPLNATIDILVQPKRGVALEGASEGQLVISSEEETLPLQFKLRGVTIGPGQLRVLAFHKGQPLGALTLTVTVLATSADTPMRRQSHEQSLEPIRLRQPDLQLLILEHIEAGEPAITFRLTAQDPDLGLYLKPFGPIRLKVEPLKYFQDFFKDIENLPLNSSSEKIIAEQRLAARGTNLFKSLFPADLQVLLWSLRSRIQSVHVLSEEPWIPWELCKLFGLEDGRIVEGPFLCEAFALARWIPGPGLKPTLTLQNMAVVVPSDSRLAFAPDEQAYLLSLSNGNRQVSCVPATFLELREALASGKYDGWHFSGHGRSDETDPNRQAIFLENREPFTPEDLSGEVSNLGIAKPFVFLNACQIGRSAMSLTGIGGWASQFLQAGAGAFVGSYWSIDDKSALDFAEAFYNRLLTGVPIGRAVQEARLAIKPTGDPTWLAYTVFAHPLATVRDGASTPQG
jgi:CHAT domain-containing protein